MKNLTLIFIVVGVIIAGTVILLFVHPQTNSPQTTVSVVASFYPLGEFARQVGGSLVNVTTVVPNGTEPHEYEPTPKDIITAESAKLFIYNGSGLDPWADKINSDLQKKGVTTLKAADHISLLPIAQGSELKNTSMDPHFWLDPISAQFIVTAIKQKLIALDPAHASQYTTQAESFIAQLVQLNQTYTNELAHCSSHTIITSHAAFQYLANRYHLTVYAISGISPDAEPSAKTLADLSQLITQQHIPYVFTESLVSPKLAETLASEAGAKTLVFNPLEGLTAVDQANHRDYISVMQDNLTQLRKALSCT